MPIVGQSSIYVNFTGLTYERRLAGLTVRLLVIGLVAEGGSGCGNSLWRKCLSGSSTKRGELSVVLALRARIVAGRHEEGPPAGEEDRAVRLQAAGGAGDEPDVGS